MNSMINNVFRFQKSIEKLYNIGLVFIESLIYIFLVRIFFKEDIIFFFYGYVLLTFLYAFILNVFMKIYGGHQLSFSKFTDLIWSFSLALFITNIISYLQNSLIAVKLLNPLYMLYIVLIQIIIGTIIIYIQWKSIYKYFPPKETLLIYNSDYSNILNKLKINGDRNFNITTFIKQEDIEENTNQLSQHEHVLLLDVSENYKEKIIKKCYEINKIVYIIPDIADVIINSASNFHLIDTPLLALNRLGPTQLEKIYKRLIDIIVSLIGILVFFPIIFVVGIFIKLEDKGPIFYNQTRLTQYGKEFTIYKLRSMKIDAESDGSPQLAKYNDDRITNIGKIIRKFRLDEIPQLINILKGDMSIVGPRPERPELAEEIYKELPEFKFRLKVKAGLTGYAQVYGKYNTSLKDKLLLDLMYIENYSLMLDFKIILMTIKIIFVKESTEGF